MISKKEVQHIAKLARLSLTEKETVKYQKDLSLLLNYVEKLKKGDISNIEKRNYFLKIKNVFRQDEPSEKNKAKKEDLLGLMPEIKDGYLKVKTIL